MNPIHIGALENKNISDTRYEIYLSLKEKYSTLPNLTNKSFNELLMIYENKDENLEHIKTIIDNSFTKLLKAINDNDIPIFSDSSFENPQITNAQKRLFKKNYNDYVLTYKSGFLNGISENITTLVQIEQQLVFNIDRINFVLNGPTVGINGYDGKINSQNISEIFTTTGTTEVVNQVSVN
jgi:hypothetical protein